MFIYSSFYLSLYLFFHLFIYLFIYLSLYLLNYLSPPIKISIIPRGTDALGYTYQQPDDRKLKLIPELLSQVAVLYGGRLSEEIFLGNYSTGCSDDLEKATNILNYLSNNIGINNNNHGLVIYKLNEYNTTSPNTEFVEQTSNQIYLIAKEILEDKKDLVEIVTKKLKEVEIISNEDIDELIGLENKNKLEIDWIDNKIKFTKL